MNEQILSVYEGKKPFKCHGCDACFATKPSVNKQKSKNLTYESIYFFSFDPGLTSDLSVIFNQRQLGTQFWKSNEGHEGSVKS